jgi:nanoRNase/pAp phosphatase (c-di-AMP/oligoRNAs hydrolase)
MTQTAFVESCAKTVTGSAAALARRSRGRPKARQLLKLLGDKKNILITTHQHPDPDALASCVAMCTLLRQKVADADVKVSFKGGIGGGLNEQFARQTELNPLPWDDAALANYDAIVLMDTQPGFGNSPLPAGVIPLVVIDHHRAGRASRANKKPKCAFCDIRPDVGAVSSIVFSYFMELEAKISPDLGATLLFAIESDLAGAAGQPGELDNIALSNLTLIADTRKLYRMRYLDLPQNFFISYAQALNNAVFYEQALMSHLDVLPSPERPAIAADFLLRFDQAKWALVSGVIGNSLLLSLRTYPGAKMSAAELMSRLVRGLGEGGGHRSKAGGSIKLKEVTPAEIERVRNVVRRRYLRALGIKGARAQRLIPKSEIAAAVMPRVPAPTPASPKPTSAKKSGTAEETVPPTSA